MDAFHLPHLPRILPTILAIPLLLTSSPISAQTGSVVGEVRSSYNHERYGGVTLKLDQEGTPLVIDGSTAPDGTFVFLNVPVGNFTLSAEKPDFAPVDSTLVVTSGGTTEITVELTPPWVADLPPIEPGSVLDSIRDVYSQPGAIGLPTADHEDRSLLPIWYRKWVRSSIPGLLEEGPQQYPIEEMEMYRWVLDHQDMEPFGPAYYSVSQPTADGKNVNMTNQEEIDRETSVAIDPNTPKYVIAASNSITGNPWSLSTFRSSDGGCSWNSMALPRQDGAMLSFDPAVAWHPDGSAWVSSIIRFSSGDLPGFQVGVFRSTTRGASWEYVAAVSQEYGNDKEMLAIDPRPVGTGYGGRIYLAWTQAGPSTGIRFRWSDDNGTNWSSEITPLSTVEGMSPHIAVGPEGKVYVAWREGTGGIKVSTSTDGGSNFGSPVQVAEAKGQDVRFFIPASPGAQILSYPVLAVDRNLDSEHYGAVHLAWMDLNATEVDTECDEGPCHMDIYFSTLAPSETSWSPPVRVHDATAVADQFNPWMAVDPKDTSGRVHLTYYSTEPGSFPDSGDRDAVRLQYVSRDPDTGEWTTPMEVATAASDDTHDTRRGYYGHYSGLVAFSDQILPVWTDGRVGLPRERHQIFSATIRDGTLMDYSCPPSEIVFIPSSKVRFKKDTSKDVEIQVFRNGSPLSGEWVSLVPLSGDAISVETPVVPTDASGKASVRVRGERRGTATLGAEAAGVSASLKFRVRGVWAWWVWAIVIVIGILIAALVIWLIWRFTKPWSGTKWTVAIIFGALFVALFTLVVWFFFG